MIYNLNTFNSLQPGKIDSDGKLGIGLCDVIIDATGDNNRTSEITSENFETNWKIACEKYSDANSIKLNKIYFFILFVFILFLMQFK